jgi:hypothetical protein
MQFPNFVNDGQSKSSRNGIIARQWLDTATYHLHTHALAIVGSISDRLLSKYSEVLQARSIYCPPWMRYVSPGGQPSE